MTSPTRSKSQPTYRQQSPEWPEEEAGDAALPQRRSFQQRGMHRLIPSRYSREETVLSEIIDNDAMLEDIILLDGVTNDRVQGEQHGLVGIGIHELVYGVPGAHIVNAAFTHAGAFGGRFNDPTRGAWYAADELNTSIAEVAYHKARRLAEIVVPELPEQRPDLEVTTYDDWLADFRAEFHVLQPREQFADFLQPEPLPQCYAASQTLARRLLQDASNGIVYESVRRPRHYCVVCFRPALVYDPRRGASLELTLKADLSGYTRKVRRLAN
ncbi:MAG TPA: RES family NAD+ phosphorylase [Terriglobales bacterium]|nr:RES family NAD+ phosphorylase [Terriglobales bacterium]